MTPTPPTAAEPQKMSTTDTVLGAVRELARAGYRCDRHSIQELTKLPMTVVDDRLKVLRDDGTLFRAATGHHTETVTYPAPRAISNTAVDGWHKIEIGDITALLTPEEYRVLGSMVAPAAVQLDQLETTRTYIRLATDLSGKVEFLMRQVRALQQKSNPDQIPLELEKS
jgi:hypothetical protein